MFLRFVTFTFLNHYVLKVLCLETRLLFDILYAEEKIRQNFSRISEFYANCHRGLKKSFVRDLGCGKNIFRIAAPGVKMLRIQVPGSGSATLVTVP
jgi:hypothetical protein